MNLFNELELSGGLKINPLNPTKLHPELSLDLSKLSPKWKIAIGLGLLAFGLYQYYQKPQEKKN